MIFSNPSFDAKLRYVAPTSTPLQFHKRLPHYSPSRLHDLTALAESLGLSRVFVKDESERLGLPAFKILGASWAVFRVLCEKHGEKVKAWDSPDELADKLKTFDPISLFAATDGNHGRAVARVARMFGLRANIFVPIGTALVRIAAIESEGASVKVVDGTYDAAVARAALEAREAKGLLIQDNSWEGYQIIPRYVIEGYSTMLWEIDEALDEMNEDQPTHVIVQIGNGSFAEAVVRHYRAKKVPTCIIGVEPESAACALESVKAGKIVRIVGPFTSIMVGMNCDSASLVSFPVMQNGINSFISISDDAARKGMKTLAQHGIVSGETGAAGVGALLELLSIENKSAREQLGIHNRSRVLVFSTEGATDPISYQHIVR